MRAMQYAARAGLVWAGFQTAMMLSSGNLTVQSAAINVVPVVLLSLWALRSSPVAALGLAAYGGLRLWMAYPVVATLLTDTSLLPKHWWIAIAAIPFAGLWLVGAQQSVRMPNRK